MIIVGGMVGLNMNPPRPSVVPCVGEKNRVGTFGWPRPVPLQPRILQCQRYDHIRHRTTSLFAALEVDSVPDNCGAHKTEKVSAPFEAISRIDFPTNVQTTLGELM